MTHSCKQCASRLMLTLFLLDQGSMLHTCGRHTGPLTSEKHRGSSISSMRAKGPKPRQGAHRSARIIYEKADQAIVETESRCGAHEDTPLQPPPRSTLYECEWWCTPSVAAAQLRKVLEPYQSMVRYARHALIYFSMGRLTCLNATPCTHELSLGDMTRAHRSVSSPGPLSCGVGHGHGDASRVHHPTGLSGE